MHISAPKSLCTCISTYHICPPKYWFSLPEISVFGSNVKKQRFITFFLKKIALLAIYVEGRNNVIRNTKVA